jgi:hypothetical protein
VALHPGLSPRADMGTGLPVGSRMPCFHGHPPHPTSPSPMAAVQNLKEGISLDFDDDVIRWLGLLYSSDLAV